jgi:hypothetical protein
MASLSVEQLQTTARIFRLVLYSMLKAATPRRRFWGDRFFTKKVQTVVDTITTWGHLKEGDANQTVIPENNNKETGRDNAANETEGLRLLIQASLQTLIQ